MTCTWIITIVVLYQVPLASHERWPIPFGIVANQALLQAAVVRFKTVLKMTTIAGLWI